MGDVRTLINLLSRDLVHDPSDFKDALMTLAREMVEKDDQISQLRDEIAALRDAFAQHESATASGETPA